MSQTRPSSVVLEGGVTEPTGFRQFCGSSSGSGFAMDSDPYRTGSKFFSASIEMGFPVTPTQTSPLATI